MAKASPVKNDFSGGELDPRLIARVDAERYKTAVDTCKNFLPFSQGFASRRQGTYYVAEVKDSSKATRVVSFEFSTTQAYILEFSDLFLRFYKNEAQILSGPPYEIATPYAEADLFQLKFTQSADVLYITHPDYAPRKLTRTADTSWTLETIVFLDGPYQTVGQRPYDTKILDPTVTITPSAVTGVGINLTVTGYVGTFFQTTDVGRVVRLQHGSTWGYARITAYTTTFIVVATVVNDFGATTATSFWRLGVYSDTSGYPAASVFYEDRLCFAGCTNSPQRVDCSVTGDYENFEPTTTAGVVADSNAVSFVLNSNDVNVIRWLTSDEKGLLVGTVANEWIVRPSSQSEALSPTNVSAKKSTAFGSADIQAIQSNKATIFIQRAKKKVRELSYFSDSSGFESNELSYLSSHITERGIVQIATSKEPQNVLWMVRSDGTLIAGNYDRDLENLKIGWHRHVVGGVSDSAGTQAKVESVAVIPNPDGTADQLWMVVNRRIDGATKRYVEFMTPYFTDEVDQQDAFFVDCGLTYDDPKTVISATQANPVVVGSTAHGFSNGDEVRFVGVAGMTELNGPSFTIANVAANTFELAGIDGTAYAAYISGGEVRKEISTVSGLSHLEGEMVSVLADGAVQPDAEVIAGAVALSIPSTVVQVGLGYESDLKLLRLEAGAQDGTALGKTQRNHRIGIMLHRSLGLQKGSSFDDLDPITFRSTADPLTRSVPLFTGTLSETIDFDYDFNNQVCLRQDQPLPTTILAVMPQLVTQDRG